MFNKQLERSKHLYEQNCMKKINKNNLLNMLITQLHISKAFVLFSFIYFELNICRVKLVLYGLPSTYKLYNMCGSFQFSPDDYYYLSCVKYG